MCSRCRWNLKFGNFTLLCGRLRERMLQKSVPHVQHDYFSSFNQLDYCFLVLSLPLPSSLLKLPTYQLKRFSNVALFLAICKVVQESFGFRIPSCGFGIPCLWILDSTSMDSGFHKQQPGFWITIMVGFRIPQTKITWITLHGAIFSSGVRHYW